MKLNEIFEPFEFTQKLNKPFNPGHAYQAIDRNGKRPNGFFSHVSKSRDPHTVMKKPNFISRYDFDLQNKDGFTHFAEVVLKTKIYQSNPFFPRIYVKKRIKDSEGKFITEYEIEKLISFEKINEKMYNNYISSLMKSGNAIADFNQFGMMVIEKAVNTGGASYIFKDEKLIEACQFIKEYQGRFDLDFHSGNMMFRRTNFGIQLVFIDPYGSNIPATELGKWSTAIDNMMDDL